MLLITNNFKHSFMGYFHENFDIQNKKSLEKNKWEKLHWFTFNK